jgi:hypothetical protein
VWILADGHLNPCRGSQADDVVEEKWICGDKQGSDFVCHGGRLLARRRAMLGPECTWGKEGLNVPVEKLSRGSVPP